MCKWTKSSLVILIIFGFFRGNFGIPGEVYFRITLIFLSLALVSAFIINYRKIPHSKPRWLLISFLSCLLVIPLAYIYSLKPVINPGSTILENGFLWNAARNTIYDLSFVSPFEEIIFRGILWGQLRRMGWLEKRIFWFQAILFWLLHFWEVFVNPLAFLTIIPISTLILSALVYYSKRVSPSILFHTAVNALIVIIFQFFLR
jgi:membrane protease YdiL (CAAX protease family)